MQPFHSAPVPQEALNATSTILASQSSAMGASGSGAPPAEAIVKHVRAPGAPSTSINRHSLAPVSTATYSVLDPVSVTVGPRSGLTAKPGDVNEIVCDYKDSTDSYIRGVADSLRHVNCIASISWRGHNPTMFKINQVRWWAKTNGGLLL